MRVLAHPLLGGEVAEGCEAPDATGVGSRL